MNLTQGMENGTIHPEASTSVADCTRDTAYGAPSLMQLPVKMPALGDAPPLTDGRSVADMAGRWHVASTKPRHEKVYANELLRISAYTGGAVGFLMPTVTYTVRSANRERRTYHRPLFPGQIFVCVADDSVELDPNHRTYPSQAIKVPDSAQKRLREDLARVELAILTDAARVNPFPFAKPGSTVKILNGRFQGFVGPVIYADGMRRKFIISIEFMGTAVSYDLEEDIELEAVD